MLPLLDVRLVWVMLCRCKVIRLKYGSFVSAAVQISGRHNFICLVSYRSIFLHEIGGILWLTLWRCWGGGGGGAGIAQWLEHRTRDWKVAGSNPCWNGGRIFFSRVDFLCWLLFRYPFHPRVTAVARKKSRSFCQKCRWQVTAKHAYTLRMWILLNRASALVTTCP